MRKQDIPAPSATTFKPAQEFIHTYGLAQWRTTSYLTAIAVLMAEGTMPTDTSIARYLSDKRTAAATALTIAPLAKSGLVEVTGETTKGRAYRLTERGEQAILRIRQIHAQWERSWEDKIDPPQPDYSESFKRLGHTIKTQEETIGSQRQTIEAQALVIASLQRELEAMRGHASVRSTVQPSGERQQMDDPFEGQ